MILAGTGFRTDPRAHAEIAEIFGRPVISLQLVDPRFYHLDTALSVLDDTTIAYYPPAFTECSRAHLETLFPDAIVVDSADAYVFGLNAVSDGRHVVHPAAAVGFAEQLCRRRFRTDRCRDVRAAQGRRIGQMLHAGGVFVTVLDTVTTSPGALHRIGDRPRRALRGAQLLAAAGGGRQRRGSMDHRCRGSPLPGLPGRIFRGEFRASQPRDHRDRPRPARPSSRWSAGHFTPRRSAGSARRWRRCATRTWCCR